MKKVSVFCFALFALIITIMPVTASELVLLGDTNQDEIVSITDVTYILKCATDIEEPFNDSNICIDIDGDGAVSTQDARKALRMAAGITAPKRIMFSDWETTIEPTCTSTGKAISVSTNGQYTRSKILPKNSHSIIKATCTKGAYCSVCLKTTSEPLGHSKSNWIIDEKPTCETKGSKHRECTVCGEIETAVIDTIAHNTQCGVCGNCGTEVGERVNICIDNKKTYFGMPIDELTNTFGEPTEVLKDITRSPSLKYYVYAEDYLNLTIFTCTNKMGIIGVYSINTSFKIVGTETISYDNVSEYFASNGVYFESYQDTIGNGLCYAFYATTLRNTAYITSGSDFRTNEALVFHLTNACRRMNNVPAVTYSEDVSLASQFHSNDMVARNYFAHTSPEGNSQVDRYFAFQINYTAYGENIVRGLGMSPYDIVNSWYNSSGHRRIMLKPEYTELGVGIAVNDSGYVYATQNYIDYEYK